jgi:hypothetical protein
MPCLQLAEAELQGAAGTARNRELLLAIEATIQATVHALDSRLDQRSCEDQFEAIEVCFSCMLRTYLPP